VQKNRNRREGRRVASIGFLPFNNKKLYYFIVFGLLFCIGSTTLSHSAYGNTMMDVSKNSMANTQVQYPTMDENIVDLKVSERNNNFVWTSMNG
jgi:hypothetical protein